MRCPRCFREWPTEFRFCPHDGEATVEQLDSSSARAKPTRLSDAVIGRRWLIRGFIGQGTAARVYLGTDTESGRPVAVKILEERHRGDTDTRSRFLREARAVASIDHPHIVKMLEAGIREDDGVPYLVMEFLFGEPFGRYLGREGAAPPDILVPALQQAAAALQAAHAKGVIHRDLKPDNLFLVGEPGDPWELKVLDFGISRLVDRSHTAVGMVLGTPAYMAPEQVLGEPADARTDVYALGMVLYHALTGVLPFAGCDDALVLAHQVHSTPLGPGEIAELDERFDAVVLRAVRKDPALRYPDMAAFADALRRLADPAAELRLVPAPEDRYTPSTELGRRLAASLERQLAVRPRG